ncbi:MAG: secondary thiamine-phosphate synthase enzyme YjbQ [Bacteroidota bacterium]
MITQTHITLPAHRRGFHLITDTILRELPPLPEAGLLHVFIQHTCAGLTINENYDPSVRVDFNSIFDRLVPEHQPYYTHTLEGSDDMPAHVKSALVGASVTIPITAGRLNLGTWQGIYLCEFRNHGGRRKLVATIHS